PCSRCIRRTSSARSTPWGRPRRCSSTSSRTSFLSRKPISPTRSPADDRTPALAAGSHRRRQTHEAAPGAHLPEVAHLVRADDEGDRGADGREHLLEPSLGGVLPQEDLVVYFRQDRKDLLVARVPHPDDLLHRGIDRAVRIVAA